MNKAIKNSVQLIGFLGSDPEVRTFGENKKMARVSIATRDIYKNKLGEWHTETQWHNLIFWGKKAIEAEKALVKGLEIAVMGRLVNRSYMDKEGVTRFVSEVVVGEMEIIVKESKAS
ncbi:single-stranded DNA-binding protein [Olivibacter sitiensis]|uniref:single-stranded DNA-binding protein n=1 Tax=Olivibacter sitiensis TaxID=376470 RepID=UPI00040956A5|nr:single-stranded DNA-binding protein [Olivibacter sitiensis]